MRFCCLRRASQAFSAELRPFLTGIIRSAQDRPYTLEMRRFLRLLKDTYTEYSRDKVPRTGAALAYYTVFSLAPLLIIVIAVAGLFFGREAVTGQLIAQIGGLVGDEGAKAISTMVASASKSGGGLVATLVGVATLLFGATGLFIQLQDALDEIWDVKSGSREGIIGFIRSRWLSLTMVLGIGFLLLVSLIISAAISFLASNTIVPVPGAVLPVSYTHLTLPTSDLV